MGHCPYKNMCTTVIADTPAETSEKRNADLMQKSLLEKYL